jgi:hypothetical protein
LVIFTPASPQYPRHRRRLSERLAAETALGKALPRCVEEALRVAGRDGSLATFLQPRLNALDRTVAQVEGWILGVAGALDAVGGVTMPEGRGAADPLH